MSIRSSTVVSYLSRTTGTFLNNGADWTFYIQFRYLDATVTGLVEILEFFKNVDDFSQPYIYLGSAPNASNIVLEVYDGTTFTDSTTYGITQSQWHWAAVTYNHTTHVFTLIVDGTTVGTITVDMSAVTFTINEILGEPGVGTQSREVECFRAWTGIKTLSELKLEFTSQVANNTTGLLWDYKFKSKSALTDNSGHQPAFTAIGTFSNVTNYEFIIGYWYRKEAHFTNASAASSMFAAASSSVQRLFKFQLRPGTLTVVADVTTVADWNFRMSYGSPITNYDLPSNTPYNSPILGLSPSAYQPRIGWGTHRVYIKVRSDDFVDGVQQSNGQFEIIHDGTPLVALTGLKYQFTEGDWPNIWAGFSAAGGDIDKIFIRRGIENAPTFDSNGVLSSTDYVIVYEDFNAGDMSAWAAWNSDNPGFPSIKPNAISDAGASGGYGVSTFGHSPSASSGGTSLINSGLQKNFFLLGPTGSTDINNGAPPPVDTGTIIVTKVVVPSTNTETFLFTAGGGLSPSTFSLRDSDAQFFTMVTPGTYSIIETERPGWMVNYAVSNGSPYNAVTVSSSETVMVTVTNTSTGPFSGIYFINPGKTNDTLFTTISGSTYSTTVVKIPNPFSRFPVGL